MECSVLQRKREGGEEEWVHGQIKGDRQNRGELTQAVQSPGGLEKSHDKKKKITYNSFSSTFCQSPCLLVHLESVLGQPAARYHYLLDSGQSNQAACSCFIELDIYNM